MNKSVFTGPTLIDSRTVVLPFPSPAGTAPRTPSITTVPPAPLVRDVDCINRAGGSVLFGNPNAALSALSARYSRLWKSNHSRACGTSVLKYSVTVIVPPKNGEDLTTSQSYP